MTDLLSNQSVPKFHSHKFEKQKQYYQQENFKESSLFQEKEDKLAQFKEKQALNDLKFISECAEFNESFGRWNDESINSNCGLENKSQGFETKSKNEQNANVKNLHFRNTLSEMSMTLKKLELGNQNKKIKHQNQLACQKSKLIHNIKRSAQFNKQKDSLIENVFDSAYTISELKKLRDDLQEQNRTTFIKQESNKFNCPQIELKTQQFQGKIDDVQLKDEIQQQDDNQKELLENKDFQQYLQYASQQDEKFKKRSRSISTSNQRNTKDSQCPLLQSQIFHMKEQEKDLQKCSPYSNLLERNSILLVNQQKISRIKYPMLGYNSGLNTSGFQIQEKNMSNYLMKIKQKYTNMNENQKTNYMDQDNKTESNPKEFESTSNKTQLQAHYLNKDSLNYNALKYKNRKSVDFESQKSKKQIINSMYPIKQYKINADIDEEHNDLIHINDQANESDHKKENLIPRQRQSSYGILNQKSQTTNTQFESSFKINDDNDNFINSNKLSSSKKKGQPYNLLGEGDFKMEEEEIYNFEIGSQLNLKKSSSTSLYQNQQIKSKITDNIDKSSINDSLKKQIQHSPTKLLKLQIQKQNNSEQNNEQSLTDREKYLKTQRRNLIQQEIGFFSTRTSFETSPNQEKFKANLFEKIKNKINISSHRATKSQNICNTQQLKNQQDNSPNQTFSLISSFTPIQNKNIQNNLNISYNRAKSQNNSKVLNPANLIQDNGQDYNNPNRLYQINEQIGNTQNPFQIKQISHSRKNSKQEIDYQQQEQQLSNSGQQKIMIKSQLNNINDNKSKIPIIQILTNRIQREFKNIVDNNLKQINTNETQQSQQYYIKDIPQQINTQKPYTYTCINSINQLVNPDQLNDMMQKNNSIYNLSDRQSQLKKINNLFDNKSNLISSQIQIQKQIQIYKL